MPDSPGQSQTPAQPNQPMPLWWLLLLTIWAGATAADRFWLAADQRLPSWDQSDYLNNALDHGRALGLLPGGGWQGWEHLLDLSPKIPPLASLIDGSIMALSGETADQASWSLALWHGLLLLVVACWGRQLGGAKFGLLAAALVALCPALSALRVDYTLEIPLTASTTLALWLLGRWQRQPPTGGRWHQAIFAALAVAGALLVKQSALLLVVLPSLWAAIEGLSLRRRRLQVLVALIIVLALLLPWLHHNWITTLGGTNRAVIESAAAEGDPPPLSLASLLWYPRLLPQQLGLPIMVPALAGALLAAWRGRGHVLAWLRRPGQFLPPGWAWLIGCTLAGALATTLSPNKDARYFAPVLPLLLLLLARGWWQLGLALVPRLGHRWPAGLLGAGLLSAGVVTAHGQIEAIHARPGSALQLLMNDLRKRVGSTPTTLLVLPSRPELNQHNTTQLGRLHGGQIVGRQPSKHTADNQHTLEQGSWFLLSGDRSGMSRAAIKLSDGVRRDQNFVRVGLWTQPGNPPLELWQRRHDTPAPMPFDQSFIRLARGMASGPAGLAVVFSRIGPEHQLDGHLLYQRRVALWAQQRLAQHPDDRDALWSMALLAILQNRPRQANHWLERLEPLEPGNPWPASYRAAVLLIDWQFHEANRVAEVAQRGTPDPVLRALADLSAALSGNLVRVPSLRHSIPNAVQRLDL